MPFICTQFDIIPTHDHAYVDVHAYVHDHAYCLLTLSLHDHKTIKRSATKHLVRQSEGEQQHFDEAAMPKEKNVWVLAELNHQHGLPDMGPLFPAALKGFCGQYQGEALLSLQLKTELERIRCRMLAIRARATGIWHRINK